MEIKTKHDLGANVWVLNKSKATKGKITEISFRSEDQEVMYRVTFENTPDFCFKYESEIFPSKERLLSYVASE